MQKLLLISHSGLSDTNANGITMKNLLTAWKPEEVGEFYCDVQPPDFTAASSYFRVTDRQVMKSFLGKRDTYRFGASEQKTVSGSAGEKEETKPSSGAARAIPGWLKKRKYNFGLKWTREYMRKLGPWGRRELKNWILEFDPDVILYMVGESIYLDELVLQICEMTGKPLVLYNGEAYRIIDLQKRRGLERAYYKRVEDLYIRLNAIASLIIYNSELLKESYDAKYERQALELIAYNSAEGIYERYSPDNDLTITYFGNLGVGRVASLLKVADALQHIDNNAVIDVYGSTTGNDREKLDGNEGICYHGFIDAEQLVEVINKSDVLLHVESFRPEIRRKLKYAFSTKIAQCLRAGRCLLTYAPAETASTQYLLKEDAAVVCSDEETLAAKLEQIVKDEAFRTHFAEKAYSVGMKNHDSKTTSENIRKIIEEIIIQ